MSQRLYLYQYAANHGICVVSEYADDGISGISMQRESLQNMLRAIEAGTINTVIVKDLSRLSRDYLKTGELLENWFPAHGARLISVNDGVDTGIPSASNDYYPIRAIMDDWYARDISRKVRAAIHARQKAGICTAAALPYGYRRAENEIVIDTEQAENVRFIFSQYAAGRSCREIACTMNADNIAPVRRGAAGWHDATIRRILQNPAYIGRLYIHKTEKRSYKNTQKRRIPQEEQIMYPVPALIQPEQFARVQALLHRNRHSRTGRDWLSGIAVCAVCGSRMHCCGNGNAARLICGGRKRDHACQNPSLRRDLLISQLAEAIRGDGIPEAQTLLPHLISGIRVSADTIYVQLKYRRPNAPHQ